MPSIDFLGLFRRRFCPVPATKDVRHAVCALVVAALLTSSGFAQVQKNGPDVVSGSATSSPETPPAVIAPPKHISKSMQKLARKYDIRKIGDRDIGSGLDFYSLERERALGQELSTEVESESRLLTDPVVTEYINRLAQNLVRHSDARVPFTVKVIDNDEINAFALPGGYFYVNTGLILAADNEAQLAGVMAHEIAHVAARHATKNATRAEIFNLASIPLIFVGGPAGMAVRNVAGLAAPLSFLKFSRDAEREADLLGMQYQYAAGYDPGEFVHFFEKLRLHDQKKNVIAKAFSTHPMTSDRIKRAQNEIADILPPKPEYVVTTSEFDEVKARLQSILHSEHIQFDSSDRPTLRRRGPAPDEAPESPKSQKNDDGRPTLRRVPN